MLANCTNPECSAPLVHGTGRFFRFPSRGKRSPQNPHGVEHFWLCGKCAEIYTLQYSQDRGVLMRSRAVAQAPARDLGFLDPSLPKTR